jgi:hypothetical protein
MRPELTRLAVTICLPMVVAASGCCVAEGTRISTPAGERPVESLAVGDQVLCRADDGTMQIGAVGRIRKHVLLSCLRIRFGDGGELRVSPWHPVASRDGWTPAGQLSPGQEVRTPSGWASISSLQTKWGPVSVYDISVQPYPNFIANNVLVHNKSYVRASRPDELPGVWIGPSDGPYPTYRRMELRPDGTGVFANGPDDVYLISHWTTDRYASPTYGFHADLLPTRNACQCPATLSGEITSRSIRCRMSCWYGGLHVSLLRAETVATELEALRKATSSAATTQPKP